MIQAARPAWLFYRAKTFLEINQSSNPQQSINKKKLLGRGSVFLCPTAHTHLQTYKLIEIMKWYIIVNFEDTWYIQFFLKLLFSEMHPAETRLIQ